MHRSHLHLWIFATASWLLFGCSSSAPPPNVLLITLDTTRADHLSCYGYGKRTSPRIDSVASRGLQFNLAIAQAAVTPVSHASILTGLNPYNHGLRVLHGVHETRLAEQHTTLAEVLQAAGWSTGAFVSAFPAGERFGMDQGYQTFDDDFLVEPIQEIVSEGGIINTGDNQRRGDHTTDLALVWLETAVRPFHMWVHYFDPHDADMLPPEEVMRTHGEPPEDTRERLRLLYDIEIEYMDRQIGRIIDRLRTTEELDNTIVVIVSDHGEGLGDHSWWTHGILYQEQIRVPLILAGPGIPKGVHSDALVSTTDIASTVYELCGIDPEDRPPHDGANLLLTAQGESDPERVVYADSINLMTYGTPVGRDVKDDMLFAVVQGRWKYIHHLTRPNESELYDLLSDRREEVNLLAALPVIRERLKELAVGHGHVPEEQLDHPGISEEDMERLRSLGYVGGQ